MEKIVISKKDLLAKLDVAQGTQMLDYTRLPLKYYSGKVAKLGDKVYFIYLITYYDSNKKINNTLSVFDINFISAHEDEIFEIYFPGDRAAWKGFNKNYLNYPHFCKKQDYLDNNLQRYFEIID